MDVHKYGFILKKLQEEDIEMLRKHRNSEAIRSKMFYQKKITSEEQKRWFSSVNNIYNFHFIICYKGEKIGLISGKNLDYEKKTSEGGIFIWSEKYRVTAVPSIASIIMADLTFSLLKFNATYAEVRIDNRKQIKYNELLGYQLVEKVESEDKLIYALTAENYFKKTRKLLSGISRLTHEEKPLSWEDVNFKHTETEQLKQMYYKLTDDVRRSIIAYLPFEDE